MEIALKFLVENPEGMKSLGDPHVDGMIILKQILNKYNVSVWTGFHWRDLVKTEKTLVFHKGRELFGHVIDYQFLKRDYAPFS
jgi:hypothetical protein